MEYKLELVSVVYIVEELDERFLELNVDMELVLVLGNRQSVDNSHVERLSAVVAGVEVVNIVHKLLLAVLVEVVDIVRQQLNYFIIIKKNDNFRKSMYLDVEDKHVGDIFQ